MDTTTLVIVAGISTATLAALLVLRDAPNRWLRVGGPLLLAGIALILLSLIQPGAGNGVRIGGAAAILAGQIILIGILPRDVETHRRQRVALVQKWGGPALLVQPLATYRTARAFAVFAGLALGAVIVARWATASGPGALGWAAIALCLTAAGVALVTLARLWVDALRETDPLAQRIELWADTLSARDRHLWRQEDHALRRAHRFWWSQESAKAIVARPRPIPVSQLAVELGVQPYAITTVLDLPDWWTDDHLLEAEQIAAARQALTES